MLKSQAIQATLATGCEQGTFVLKLARPDGTYRTWWRSRPDDAAMNDPAMELVLPEAAEINEIGPALLAHGVLPGLWQGQRLAVRELHAYFAGGKVVQVERGGYNEPIAIPKADTAVVDAVVRAAVEAGILWLVNGPASILAEPIPAGILTADAALQAPPPQIGAAEILDQTLPGAWEGGTATGLSIATALSQRFGQTLPWKTVRDVIDSAIRARFAELDPLSATWPCDVAGAGAIRLRPVSGAKHGAEPAGAAFPARPNTRTAAADLTVGQLQDLSDVVPQLLEIKAKHNFDLRVRLQIEVGAGGAALPEEILRRMNQILRGVSEDLEIK